MLVPIKQTYWFLASEWVFHHHLDETCTAYNPYSGAVLALDEAGGWVLKQIARSPLTTEALAVALAKEEDRAVDADLSTFLEATLNTLFEDARLIRLVVDS
ncbi:MAG: hypothetical protein IPI21_11095 [Propionivibrio sp.]|nr:hypothetical protein [Propionivibrio sp.]